MATATCRPTAPPDVARRAILTGARWARMLSGNNLASPLPERRQRHGDGGLGPDPGCLWSVARRLRAIQLQLPSRVTRPRDCGCGFRLPLGRLPFVHRSWGIGSNWPGEGLLQLTSKSLRTTASVWCIGTPCEASFSRLSGGLSTSLRRLTSPTRHIWARRAAAACNVLSRLGKAKRTLLRPSSGRE